jgi:hypothetical protein
MCQGFEETSMLRTAAREELLVISEVKAKMINEA